MCVCDKERGIRVCASVCRERESHPSVREGQDEVSLCMQVARGVTEIIERARASMHVYSV